MARSKLLVLLFGSACALTPARSANAADIAWVPLEADGPHTVNGNEIILQGGGQLVTLEIRISNWDPDLDGIPEVGLYQAAVDASGYASGAGAPLTAFADPTPLDGAFQILKMCHEFIAPDIVPTGIRCDSPRTCPPGQFCLDNPDFIFAGILAQAAVSTATPNFVWGAVSNSGTCAVDDGVTARYGGTLILVVPPTAAGTYTIDFDANTLSSFLNDCPGTRIPDVTFTPAQITIACQSNAECDDGNACTDDVCGLDSRCSSVLNFDDAVFCCDPNAGGLTRIDDGNECTVGACNAADGTVTQSPKSAGTACGGPPFGECDAQDTCDGAGVCEALFKPALSPCGDGSATECTSPDTCDGAGVCLANHEPPGTTCGDPTPTQCSDADTCNGLGACNVNHLSNGTPCDDGAFCNEGEACLAGVCTGGQFACDDGVACTDDSCDEGLDLCDNVPNDSLCDNGLFCDGVEICDGVLNCVVEPGTVPDCNDGIPCTDDSCDELNDTCRFVPNDANCNNGLFCDGIEICDSIDNCVLQAGSVPDCADTIDCTVDSCNEAADRCDNLPNDNLCPDDGLFCNGAEICDAGAGCISTGCPCGTSCELSCDEQQDLCLCEAPLAEAVGSRYIMVTPLPADSTAPQAIVITPACPAGQLRYVGTPQPWDVNGDDVTDGSLAFLVDNPADAAFLTPAQWGAPVYITGSALVPETSHIVQVDCGAPGAPSLSGEALPRPATWVWGDTDHNDTTNFSDIQFMVFGFQGTFIPGKQILPNLDIRATTFCELDQLSNFNDIQAGVLAFQGQEYIETGCPFDCPPCLADVQCNDHNTCTTDACNPDASCSNIPNFDEQLSCCNPTTGLTTDLDDGDPCTDDVCNAANGRVTHIPLDCDDGVACTLDACIGGICSNNDIDVMPCADNSDCPPVSPGCDGNSCTCPGTPAALFEWQPVSSTGPYTISGNEITIPQGGVQVTVELFVSNWSPERLRGYEAAIDGASSYVSGISGSLSPLTDPDPSAGAFIVQKRCTANAVDFFDSCDGGAACPPGMFCMDNPDFVFAGRDALTAVATFDPLHYIWGGVILSGSGPLDDGSRKYCGTLILEVSPDAAGTFTLEFDPSIGFTFLLDDINASIVPLTLQPGLITVGTGKCCSGFGSGQPVCEDGITADACAQRPGSTAFSAGESCTGDAGLDCTVCNVDSDCNDGNACTTDSCNTSSICSHIPSFDSTLFCCNPANGQSSVIDDLDQCTVDSCDAASGQVSHVFIPGCTPPSACSIENDADCKFGPDMYLLMSDRNGIARFADDFRPAGPTISQVCWWPCFVNTTAGTECAASPPPDDFIVRFYEDLGGLPEPEIGPPGGQPLLPSDKVFLGGTNRCWSYTAPLANPVNVTPGDCYWVEITGAGVPGGCSVFLADSAEGNDYSLLDVDGSYGAGDVFADDLALCLDSGFASTDDCGAIPGACCVCGQGCLDAADGMDHVQCAAQGGLFSTGTACADVLCGAPVNDDCAASTPVSHPAGNPANDILVDFNVQCATKDGPSPVLGCEDGDQPMGHDIWYDYVAPCDGDLIVSLCDNTDFDSMLVVYGSGASCTCPIDGSTQLSCNDDGCAGSFSGGAGVVTIPAAVTGDCFTIRVGGWGNADTPGGGASFGTGTMRVTMACGGAPTILPPCEAQKLIGTDTLPLDSFGYSVALDGTRALIGARDDELAQPATGSAYVFRRDPSGWVQENKLVDWGAAGGDRFGAAVSLTGDVTVAGAPQLSINGGGKVSIFGRQGSSWVQSTQITLGNFAVDDGLGFSVAASIDTGIFGAPWNNTPSGKSGAALVHRWNGSQWVSEAKLIASDGAVDDLFGWSVAIDGDYAVVAALGSDNPVANAGAVYVFFRTGSTWNQQARLSASDAVAGGRFGSSVAISGNRVAVGSEGVNTNAGAVYVFERSGTTWSQSAKLVAGDRLPFDRFGFALDIDGDSLVVGAIGDSDFGDLSGAAYVFRLVGPVWNQIAKVTSSDAAAVDVFGWSVAVQGDRALIGAVGDNGGTGAVYDFALAGPDVNANGIIDACE